MCSDHQCEHRKRVRELESEVAKLKAELEKYRKPPKDSNNSSLPPSQDPYSKRYPKRKPSGRKPGGQDGHKGHHHPFQEPDVIEPLYPQSCDHCGFDQLLPLEEYKQVCQEVNLPELKPVVTEYRQCIGLCRRCGKRSRGRFPKHLKAPVQMGQSFSGLIGYLKQVHHLSHQRITHFVSDLFNLSISEGFVQNRLESLKDSLQEIYNAIEKALPGQEVIGSDETRCRINGQNTYQWVFQSEHLSYFAGNSSRKFDVVKDLFGEAFKGSWVSDRLGSQLKIRADHQLCLAHLIRDFQYAIEADKSNWAKQVQKLLREMIHYRKQQGNAFDPINNQDTFRQCQGYRDQLNRLFQKPPPKKQKEANKLYHSLVGRQHQMVLFLTDARVPYDNNASERALRKPVVHRKVLGGFRTDKGSKCSDIILSVIETGKKQGLNILDLLCNNSSLIFQS